MKTLAIIPARGGSKGIPNKNIKPFNGKPLIQHTIEIALKVFDKEEICISTDSEQIKSTAELSGVNVPFIRPPELAEDSSGMYEVLLHALNFYKAKGREFDTIILLQPTSPFRNSTHIQEAMSIYNDSIEMVVSVKETASNPYYILFEEDDKGFLQKSKKGNFTRRQDVPKVWEYNGAIYVINVKTLLSKPIHQFERVIKYEMDEMSSLDLDTPLDWEIAEYLFKKLNYEKTTSSNIRT